MFYGVWNIGPMVRPDVGNPWNHSMSEQLRQRLGRASVPSSVAHFPKGLDGGMRIIL